MKLVHDVLKFEKYCPALNFSIFLKFQESMLSVYGVTLGHSGIYSTLDSRNRVGLGVEMSHHLLIPFLTVLHFT